MNNQYLDETKNVLEACPFCGGEPTEDASACVDYFGHEHQNSSIECRACGLEMTVYAADGGDFPCSCCHDVGAEVRRRWNRRAGST